MEKEEKGNNKMIMTVLVSCLIVGGVSFFGGMKFAQSRGTFRLSSQAQRFGQMGGNLAGRRGGQMNGGNFVMGEVLSKDDKSVTLKLADGGSKIIFLSSSTTVMMSSSGSLSDVKVGETISANGSTNSDGSITAQSLQIRPKLEGNVSPPAQR